jgi:hypothetical protein
VTRLAGATGSESRNACSNRDLPMPGSPQTSAIWPSPAAARRPPPAFPQQAEFELASDHRRGTRAVLLLERLRLRGKPSHLDEAHLLLEAL